MWIAVDHGHGPAVPQRRYLAHVIQEVEREPGEGRWQPVAQSVVGQLHERVALVGSIGPSRPAFGDPRQIGFETGGLPVLRM